MGSAAAGSWLKDFEECKELAQEIVQLIQVSKLVFGTTNPASSTCLLRLPGMRHRVAHCARHLVATIFRLLQFLHTAQQEDQQERNTEA